MSLYIKMAVKMIMLCHLFGTKPLCTPDLTYHLLDHGQHIPVKFELAELIYKDLDETGQYVTTNRAPEIFSCDILNAIYISV